MFYLNDAFIVEFSERTRTSLEESEKSVLEYAVNGAYDIEHCYLRFFGENLRESLNKCPQEETVSCAQKFMAENEEALKRIVAGWIKGRGRDGRLYPAVQSWAAGVDVGELCGCPLHSCYLNLVALRLFVAPGQNVPMF